LTLGPFNSANAGQESFSPDGRYFALVVTAEEDAQLTGGAPILKVWDTENGGQAVFESSKPDPVETPWHWGPAGSLWIAPPKGVKEIWTPPHLGDMPFANARTVAFSPDGRRVLAGEPDGAVKIWEVTTSQVAGEDKRNTYRLLGASEALKNGPRTRALLWTSDSAAVVAVTDAWAHLFLPRSDRLAHERSRPLPRNGGFVTALPGPVPGVRMFHFPEHNAAPYAIVRDLSLAESMAAEGISPDMAEWERRLGLKIDLEGVGETLPYYAGVAPLLRTRGPSQ
jgi:hypothetical protein